MPPTNHRKILHIHCSSHSPFLAATPFADPLLWLLFDGLVAVIALQRPLQSPKTVGILLNSSQSFQQSLVAENGCGC